MFNLTTHSPNIRTHFRALMCCFLALAACAAPSRAQSSQDPVYVFHTSLGDMRVQLFPDVAPQTVANFLSYVNSGAYNSSFFHRSVSSFIIQGGGYTVNASGTVATIPTNAPVVNEFHLSNTRGTIAMAKLGSDPNSATDEWFFNEEDNSANLDNQNGGFTVFGKVVDSASLAVMDAISAEPIYNEGSPFDQLPLINYQSGAITQSNFVRVTSITPSWSAVSQSVGPDGYTRAIWDNATGTAAFWLLNPSNQFVSQTQYGPYSGWTARALSTGPDLKTRVLWTNTSGQAAFWRLDANNNYIDQQQYGPYSGWTVTSLSVGADGYTRVIWNNVNGTAAFWLLDPTNRYVSQQNYGPFSGWTAQGLAAGPDLKTRVLWTNTNGAAAFWRLDANNNYIDQQGYGPISGWTATSLSVGADGYTRVIWNNVNGTAAFWLLDPTNRYVSQQQFGPFSGWTAQSVVTGPDLKTRALWTNLGGQSAFWLLDPNNNFLSQQNYGPF